MRLFPAIDLKDGRCVRLRQGRFDEASVYAEDPAKVAVWFARQGARYIHTVDLDGALAGKGVNAEALARIVKAVSIPVQTGGGIRNMEQIEERFACGAARVIIGTAAVRDPGFVREALRRYGAERIVVGIDAEGGMAAVNGWKEIASVSAVRLGKAMYETGLRYAVYTDIGRDGMLSGPNVESTCRMQEETGLTVIASGGVSGIEDLARLSEAGIYGAVIGKAIYEKRIDLKEAVRRFEEGERE